MDQQRLDERLDALADAVESRPAGLFITFEGGDGCGKSTQVSLLADALESRGVDVLATYEPGATELGASLRLLIQHGPEDVDPRTEALLYAADRAYHVANVIRPALARGTLVLEDRYIDSSVAYQGAARELGPTEIRGISNWATTNLQPNLTVLYDVDTSVGLSRIGRSLDRLERAGNAFHERVRAHYLSMAGSEPGRFIIIDASQNVDEVFVATVNALIERLAR